MSLCRCTAHVLTFWVFFVCLKSLLPVFTIYTKLKVNMSSSSSSVEKVPRPPKKQAQFWGFRLKVTLWTLWNAVNNTFLTVCAFVLIQPMFVHDNSISFFVLKNVFTCSSNVYVNLHMEPMTRGHLKRMSRHVQRQVLIVRLVAVHLWSNRSGRR